MWDQTDWVLIDTVWDYYPEKTPHLKKTQHKEENKTKNKQKKKREK